MRTSTHGLVLVLGPDPDEVSVYVQDPICYGCAHSAADAPYPGRPSGERPCGICSRTDSPIGSIGANDGTVISGPKDMYITMDRLMLEAAGHQSHSSWLYQSYARLVAPAQYRGVCLPPDEDDDPNL